MDVGRSCSVLLLMVVASPLLVAGCGGPDRDSVADATSRREIASVLAQVISRVSAGEAPRSVQQFFCAASREGAQNIDTPPPVWTKIQNWSIASIDLSGDTATVTQNGTQTYVTRDGSVFPNSMNGQPVEDVRMVRENGGWRVCPRPTVWSRGG